MTKVPSWHNASIESAPGPVLWNHAARCKSLDTVNVHSFTHLSDSKRAANGIRMQRLLLIALLSLLVKFGLLARLYVHDGEHQADAK